MPHPYEDLPADRFWRTGVAELQPLEIAGLWKPKFRIRPRTRIVTAGSCFAQHFSKALVARGYRWVDHEPGPEGLTAEQKKDYHYGTFSFRTGNIYTPKMLRQWLNWAYGVDPVPQEVWESNGRFFDPFRPGVEPGGFASAEELHISREVTFAAIRASVETAHVFVFTMGLTEAWRNKETGVEYAVCPGTLAGEFDPEKHEFVNHRFSDLLADMMAAVRLMGKTNRGLNILLTVSPVPLTATASGQHVLTATSQSKSMLRALAATVAEGRHKIDYFPSYEIIIHPAYRGMFFAQNLRSVLPAGVDHVMASFFRDQAAMFEQEPAAKASDSAPDTEAAISEAETDLAADEELRCEEEILAAFAPR